MHEIENLNTLVQKIPHYKQIMTQINWKTTQRIIDFDFLHKIIIEIKKIFIVVSIDFFAHFSFDGPGGC